MQLASRLMKKNTVCKRDTSNNNTLGCRRLWLGQCQNCFTFSIYRRGQALDIWIVTSMQFSFLRPIEGTSKSLVFPSKLMALEPLQIQSVCVCVYEDVEMTRGGMNSAFVCLFVYFFLSLVSILAWLLIFKWIFHTVGCSRADYLSI